MGIRLIHIAPELPPEVGGVADYTAILSRRLVEVSDGAVEPVLVHAGNQSADEIDGPYPVTDLSGRCSAAALADTIGRLADEAEGPAVILLEYSGYGYAKRGAPWWLVRGLRRTCGPERLSLVTMFHELYATGPPWTSAFWMSFPQAWVARGLAWTSRSVLTNRAASARWLRQSAQPSCPVRVQPTFSNVGEPSTITEFRERKPHVVVFGSRSMKKRVYSKIQEFHVRGLTDAGVSRVVEVGRSTVEPETLHGLPIERHGVQPAQTISAILRDARGGLLHYPIDYLTKSGIWASYAAHGVPPLVMSKPASTGEINEGEHYIRLEKNPPENEPLLPQLRSVGKKAWEWYRDNAASVIAARQLMNFLQGHDEHREAGKRE